MKRELRLGPWGWKLLGHGEPFSLTMDASCFLEKLPWLVLQRATDGGRLGTPHPTRLCQLPAQGGESGTGHPGPWFYFSTSQVPVTDAMKQIESSNMGGFLQDRHGDSRVCAVRFPHSLIVS